ncbi:MAG: L-threonylcarbamoyladenylate synthase [Treponema sp.]|nr:L-threonylcarbamoyladenylate synthase [Treponema sp.]
MEILSTSDGDLEKAAAALAAGLLVAFPTETVYGLGADAFNPSSLAKIFEAKHRPRFDPLIIHIAELNTLSQIVDYTALNETAKKRLSVLSQRLWPGPLTLILPKLSVVPDLATAGLGTAAVRFPSHPVARKLVRLSGCPVAAPSANLFGCLSPTRAEHVKTQLGESVDFIIDGGRTTVGVESTVLDLSGDKPRVLRPGGTPREAIEALIGPVEIYDANIPEAADGTSKPLSPGQLKSHYAPGTPLFLYRNGELASLPDKSDEGRLYFSAPAKTPAIPSAKMSGKTFGITDGDRTRVLSVTRVLSATGDMTEAAANLFDMLHELDSLGLRIIRAEEAPSGGLGEAINDRLRRAGSKNY